MPVQFDAGATNMTYNTGLTTITCAITPPANANRVLVACIGSAQGLTVTSITDSLTQTWPASYFGTVTASGNRWEMWYLINPAASATTVTANMSGAISTDCDIGLFALSGADQTTPLTNYTPITSSQSPNPPSITVSGATANDLVVGSLYANSAPGAMTSGTAVTPNRTQNIAALWGYVNGATPTLSWTSGSGISRGIQAAVVHAYGYLAGGILLPASMSGGMQEMSGGFGE